MAFRLGASRRAEVFQLHRHALILGEELLVPQKEVPVERREGAGVVPPWIAPNNAHIRWQRTGDDFVLLLPGWGPTSTKTRRAAIVWRWL